MNSFAVFSVALLAAAVAVAGSFAPVQKKFIAHGWDMLAVSPEEVLANAEAFDRTAIDGVTLMLGGKFSNGRAYSHSRIMNDSLWPREELEKKIEVFREIVKHPSLRESFLSTWWAPQKRLKWDDDAAWATFAANMGTVAYLAKAGGLKGILVDGEDYPKTRQYYISPGDRPYAETAQLARRRGAQVFKAIFDEYPDVTFLSFWMLSLNAVYFRSPDPMGVAENAGDLWPWFLNGMLDVIPPQARFIDGNEHAYRYQAARRDFYFSANQQRATALALVAPENRGKYRAQMLAGFGLYMDSYIAPTNSTWYIPPVQGSRTMAFAENLGQAADACDGYVWIYGEHNSWVHWQGTKNARFSKTPTWEEALPGLACEMMGVKDPRGLASKMVAEMREQGKYVNRALESKRPWSFWCDDKLPPGKTGEENGEAFIAGCGSGCYIVKVKSHPGVRFAVRVRMKGMGGGSTAYWQRGGGWNWKLPGTPVTFGAPDADGWRLGEAMVRVPEGADTMALQLGAKQVATDKVSYRDLEIVEFR